MTVEKSNFLLIVGIIIFFVTLIIVYADTINNISNKFAKVISVILVLDTLFLCFLAYAGDRVDKLIEAGSIFRLENVEKITVDTKYIAENTTAKSIDSDPISVGNNGYIVLFDGENDTIIDELYAFHNTELVFSDNIKEFSKDGELEEGNETAKIEKYYLKNTCKANEDLSKLDKICVRLTTKVKFNSSEMTYNTNDYYIIYVSKNDYIELKNQYLNKMK